MSPLPVCATFRQILPQRDPSPDNDQPGSALPRTPAGLASPEGARCTKPTFTAVWRVHRACGSPRRVASPPWPFKEPRRVRETARAADYFRLGPNGSRRTPTAAAVGGGEGATGRNAVTAFSPLSPLLPIIAAAPFVARHAPRRRRQLLFGFKVVVAFGGLPSSAFVCDWRVCAAGPARGWPPHVRFVFEHMAAGLEEATKGPAQTDVLR